MRKGDKALKRAGMAIVVGYIFVGPRTVTARKQKNALVKVGVDRDRIWIDEAPSRLERDEMLERGLRQGDTVIVAMASAIGSGGNTRDRAKVLKRLGELDVKLQVGEGPPILYDTPEKIDNYMKMAAAESRALNGRALGKKSTGRPIVYTVTDEQKQAICALWYNRNIDIAAVLSMASDMIGKPVKRHHLKHWCGTSRTRPAGENGDTE